MLRRIPDYLGDDSNGRVKARDIENGDDLPAIVEKPTSV
jgi:hypothetical protein